MMFDKFAEHSIRVVMRAQEEARKLGHDAIGIELLLLALALEQRGIASKALAAAGLSKSNAQIEIEKVIGRGSGFCPTEIPLTPLVKNVITAASVHARELTDVQIETEHLLLAILDVNNDSVNRIFSAAKVERARLKDDLLARRASRAAADREQETQTFSQGDVVLIEFEVTADDGKVQLKRRPMVVITSNDHVTQMSAITVLPLTSNPRERTLDSLEFIVESNSPAGKAAGLRVDSVVACTFVYTYPKAWVQAKIGKLPDDVVGEILRRLLKLLSL